MGNHHELHAEEAAATTETLRKLKKTFRLNMDGEVSTYLRRHSSHPWRIIFGITIARLRAIAAEMEKDQQLAITLWAESVRESKIIATLLFEVSAIDDKHFEQLVDESPTNEILEQLVFNLGRHLPAPEQTALRLLNSNATNAQQAATLLIDRAAIDRAKEWSEAYVAQLLKTPLLVEHADRLANFLKRLLRTHYDLLSKEIDANHFSPALTAVLRDESDLLRDLP